MKTLLFIFLLLPSLALASNEEDEAVKAAFNAGYKQFGLEQQVEHLVEIHIPRDLREIATKVHLVTDVVIRQRIDYTWNF
jgi:hypothetical protein